MNATAATKAPHDNHHTQTLSERRVIFAAIIGTAIEWYDFFIYATAASLVFADLFFKPAGAQFAQILAFVTVGISFLFRPLGAFLAGHFGDRYGRRMVFVLTLILMGCATFLVGVLPTFSTIGMAAPILLVLLRMLQGISAGGEWGGAVLFAVEHAPTRKRGLFGATPQIGVPIGLLLASGVMALMTVIAPGDAFMTWGWRIPFLLSVVLIIVGYYVRRRLNETPVFKEIAAQKQTHGNPIGTLFRKHTLLVIIAALVFAGNSAVGYMTTGGYIQRYATNPEGPLGLANGPVLWAVTGSAITWLIATLFAGWLSDFLGRRNTYLVGWVLQLVGVFALFPLVNIGTVWSLFLALALLTIGLGFTYGPQSTLYSELFPARIRFSGISISYAFGAIIGGAFSPTIAQAIVQATGSVAGVTWYLAGMTLVGLIATLLLRDRTAIPLGPNHEENLSAYPVYGLSHS